MSACLRSVRLFCILHRTFLLGSTSHWDRDFRYRRASRIHLRKVLHRRYRHRHHRHHRKNRARPMKDPYCRREGYKAKSQYRR